MFLKSLEVQGFKSFADRIVLHFNKGLTSVVGPNGSGKSNIADAVRWVLGEQSAKTLRGGKMEDIIFAGTQHRKPVGFAAVTITIDNSDHMLPVDYTEVMVSRRIYRSGESEYYLNKTICRLKDIQELFMNTGVGREGYSIIGQGRIDEILSSRSEERRLVFEEACGITKYKVRKKEAERKLESTRQNLLRINDILVELENQIIPLQQQAETARRYIDLSNELKGIEVSVFLETIDKLKDRMSEIEVQAKTLKEQIDEENRRIENVKNKNRTKNESLEKLKAELEALRNQIHMLDNEIEKSEGHVRLCEEKINHLTSNNANFGEDISSIKERIIQLDQDIEKKQKRMDQLCKDTVRFEKLLLEAEETLKGIVARLDYGERLVEEAKQTIMDKQDSLSDVKIRLNNLKNDADNYRQLKTRLQDEIRQSILEKDKQGMQKEDLESSLRKTRENITQTKRNIQDYDLKKLEIQKRIQEYKSKYENIRREINTLESRHKVLNDMEESMEGYSHSVKAIMQACHENKAFGNGIHGALAQLISVEERFETAIEVSLGGALQNIVTDDEYSAKRAIEYLKNNRFGRATFLPITSIRSRKLEQSILSKVQGMKGFLSIASDKVNTQNEFSDVLLNLLGRTVIVDSMDNGIKMARQFDYAFRIVTLDGEILNSGGSLTGGSTGGKTSSIIGRSRIIKELEENIKVLTLKLSKSEEEIHIVESELRSVIECLEKEQKSLSDFELVRLRDESHLARIIEDIRKLSAKVEMHKQQDTEIEQQIEDVKTESEKEAQKAQTIEEEIKILKDQVLAHQTKNRDEQAKRDELHTDINDYRVSVNSVAESKQSVTEQIALLNTEKDNILSNLSRREAEKERNIERIRA